MNLTFELMAPLMFVGLFLFLLLGYPVAFALAANGMLFAFIGFELGLLEPILLQALPDRVFGIMANSTLLAIPFFTLMGIILERSGMAEDLLDTIGKLFGPIRGGVAYAVIFVGALLAATTGVVAASVIAMGLISLPVMLRYGYSKQVATGVICASGTLAQIIPPSLVLIVLGDQMGVSVGDMYEGALIPGLMLVGLLAAYIFIMSIVKPSSVPALPKEAWMPRQAEPPLKAVLDHLPLFLAAVGLYFLLSYEIAGGLAVFIIGIAIAAAWTFIHAKMKGTTFNEELSLQSSPIVLLVLVVLMETLPAFETTLWYYVGGLAALLVLSQSLLGAKSHNKVVAVLAPPLILIFLVLGTIFLGVATPTEGGAMGAVGAIVLALVRKRLNLKLLTEAVTSTTKLTCFVLFILIGSTVFALTFRAVDGDLWVEHLFALVPGGAVGFLFVVNLMVFILGFFIDFFEIAFILIPLLVPVAQKLDINLVWFGVMIAVNMQTSFLTPPFGFSLFYLRSVAPKSVTTADIYKGIVPFVAVQLVALGIVIAFPGLVVDELAFKKKQEQINQEIQGDFVQDAFPPPVLEGQQAPAEDPAAAFKNETSK
jgi:TRAP-type mannitol/chloroaromatic compound transport system permease large subunit